MKIQFTEKIKQILSIKFIKRIMGEIAGILVMDIWSSSYQKKFYMKKC